MSGNVFVTLEITEAHRSGLHNTPDGQHVNFRTRSISEMKNSAIDCIRVENMAIKKRIRGENHLAAL